MNTQTFLVDGMTCGHCAGTVQTKVQGVDGVERATVDLAAKSVTVESSAIVDDEAIAAAVTEAGYAFSGRA